MKTYSQAILTLAHYDDLKAGDIILIEGVRWKVRTTDGWTVTVERPSIFERAADRLKLIYDMVYWQTWELLFDVNDWLKEKFLRSAEGEE